MNRRTIGAAAAAVILLAGPLAAESLDIPSSRWGISFGNSKNFTGLRFNFRDRGVERIRGVNVTFWTPRGRVSEEAVIDGLSLGLAPGGGTLRGVQVGWLGVGAAKGIRGLTFGLLGVGSGGSIKGITVGGLGVGADGDLAGITVGGLGIGADGNLSGINIGGLGIGADGDLVGINIGGLGVGASGDVRGINVGGLGLGSGGRLAGITVAGLGLGGATVSGLAVAGLGAGGKRIRGIVAAGIAAGGKDVRGVLIAGAFTAVSKGGEFRGLAFSPVNWHRGSQFGLSVGVVNYAWTLKGLQVGLVNIVRSNPPGLRVLPVFNAGF